MEYWNWLRTLGDTDLPHRRHQPWFQASETMDPEERDERTLVRIGDRMADAQESLPFYRRKSAGAIIESRNIRTFSDFVQVSVVTKEEIRGAQVWHSLCS